MKCDLWADFEVAAACESILQSIESNDTIRANRIGGLMTFQTRMRGNAFWVTALILAMAAVAMGHHSFAVYDHTRTMTLKGSVTKFQWTNPHAFLELDVKDAKGATKHYTLEGTSINMMQRIGWKSNMIKFGDQVKAVMAPLLSGEPAGLLLEVTLPSGETKELGVPAGSTFKRTPEQDQK